MAKGFAAFAKTLKLEDGSPLIPEDFQADFVKDVEAGNSEIWWLLPEGNGKTPSWPPPSHPSSTHETKRSKCIATTLGLRALDTSTARSLESRSRSFANRDER